MGEGSDLFNAYVNRTPRILEVLDQATKDGIEVAHIRFESVEGSFDNKEIGPSEVYAIMAKPAGIRLGSCPGILICHGGKGGAEEAKAIGWAKEGFVAIAPELPGWADTEYIKSRSRFRGLKYGTGRLAVTPAVTASGVFDAIVAGLGAFQLLRSDPLTDPARIGITGISWGGYLTTLLAGLLGQQVRAAFSLYGGGFFEAGSVFMNALSDLPDEERRLWLDTYDAGRFAAGVAASFLMFPAANDSFFYPPSIMATYNALPGDKKWLCFGPTMDHQMNVPGGTLNGQAASFTLMEPVYFRHAMNDDASGMPALKKTDAAGTELIVSIEGGLQEAMEVWGYYSADRSVPWPRREWKPLKLLRKRKDQMVFAAPLPPSAEFEWFAGVCCSLKDSGGSSTSMSLSTVIYSE